MKKTKPIKFESFFGFALTGAKKKGDRVVIGFQFNVKDGYDELGKARMAQHALDDYVYPEIMRRIENKRLDSTFRLKQAHVLMFSNYSRNTVLLNEEVKLFVIAKQIKKKKYKENEKVLEKDVKEILGIYPTQKNDPNAAHIMLLKFKGDWLFAADLIYDRKKVKNKYKSARSFLKSAQHNIEEKLWDPFVENLFDATELSVQSILLLRHYNKYSLKQNHEETRKLFTGYCEMGNAPIKFSKHNIMLYELRKKARYQQGTHGKQFVLKKNEGEQLLKITTEMIHYTDMLLQTIDSERKLSVKSILDFKTNKNTDKNSKKFNKDRHE